jgi:thiol-disulfide isomerase/thioredoxin
VDAWDVGQLVLWLVVLCNLLLTVALARRVAALGTGGPAPGAPVGGLPAGAPAPAFTAVTPDGAERTSAELGPGPLLLGFFSPTCEACHDHAPHFAELARRAADEGATAVAVVDGDAGGSARLRERLPADLPVLLAQRPANPLLGAYLVDAYPTYTAVVDGTVAGSFGGVAELQAWWTATLPAREAAQAP